MLAEDPLIDAHDLPPDLTATPMPADPGSATRLADQERALLAKVYRETNGNQSETARRLGIGRAALRYKLKKCGL